jgi:hypothetical protein
MFFSSFSIVSHLYFRLCLFISFVSDVSDRSPLLLYCYLRWNFLNFILTNSTVWLNGNIRSNQNCVSPASHRSGPGSSPGQVMLDLWWAKWHWGRFSPANSHSTDRLTIIIIIYHVGAGTTGQTVAAVPSGLSLTPWEKMKKTCATLECTQFTSFCSPFLSCPPPSPSLVDGRSGPYDISTNEPCLFSFNGRRGAFCSITSRARAIGAEGGGCTVNRTVQHSAPPPRLYSRLYCDWNVHSFVSGSDSEFQIIFCKTIAFHSPVLANIRGCMWAPLAVTEICFWKLPHTSLIRFKAFEQFSDPS